MNVIVRNFNGVSKLIKADNVSISYDEPGVMIESKEYMKLFAELKDFKPSLVGRIIKIEVKSISLFD